MQPDVIIVGAGLAGLSCALNLQRLGLKGLILEATDRAGGRVQTDLVEGFRLDRGFQVYLDSYPEPQKLFDIESLSLQFFEPGSLVRHAGQFYTLADPWRRPLKSFQSLVNPIGSFADKARIGSFRYRVIRKPYESLVKEAEVTTLERLGRLGFSRAMIDRFFRPFLGGVFLDRNLDTSSRMLDFVFRMFSLGRAGLPAEGMCALPNELALRLPSNSIRFQTRVIRTSSEGVVTESGEVISARRIVVATDAPSAHQLVDEKVASQGREVWCFYFVAAEPPPVGRWLVLNGDGRGPINNLCVPTNIATSYGPGNEHLISVTSLASTIAPEQLLKDVQQQLVEWFGNGAESWRMLKSYRIPYALPDQRPYALSPWERPVRLQPYLYLCGDHRDDASINGALKSGRRAAEAIALDLADEAR